MPAPTTVQINARQSWLDGFIAIIGIDPIAVSAPSRPSGELVLDQAEEIGSEIERLPYGDYLDDIAKTGTACVVSYGDAFFVDGKLTYYPERRTVLVKPRGDGQTFEVSQP